MFLFFGIVLAVAAGLIGFFLIDKLWTQLPELNGKGELIESFQSPNNSYIAKSYLIDDGGATVASQIRVGITSVKSNKSPEFNDDTVYWEYRADSAEIKWISEDTILINGKKVDINDKETYYNWKDHVSN